MPTARIKPGDPVGLRGEGRGEGPRRKGGLAEGEKKCLSTKLRLVERPPLTRNLREERANSDLAPQAGRGKTPGCCLT